MPDALRRMGGRALAARVGPGYAPSAIATLVLLCGALQAAFLLLHIPLDGGPPRYGWIGVAPLSALLAATWPLMHVSRRRAMAEDVAGFEWAYLVQNTLQILWVALLCWMVHPAFSVVGALGVAANLFSDLRMFHDARVVRLSYLVPVVLFLVWLQVAHGGQRDAVAAQLVVGTAALVVQAIIHMVGPQYREHDQRAVALAQAEQSVTELRDERMILGRYFRLLEAGLSSGRFAHDVRTPITVIRGQITNLEELSDDIPNPARASLREAASDLEQASRRLLDMTRSLALGLRGDDQGGPISASDLASEALIEAENRLADVGIRIGATQVDVEPALLPAGLTGTVANLLINAVKHGGEPVHLEGHRRPNAYRLVIRDHGLDGEARERALERMRSSMSMKPAAAGDDDGYGIGLGLARVGVMLVGGHIEVRPPTSGRGIVVEIDVPCREP